MNIGRIEQVLYLVRVNLEWELPTINVKKIENDTITFEDNTTYSLDELEKMSLGTNKRHFKALSDYTNK